MPEVRPIDANALLKKCIEGDGDNKFTEGYNFAVQEISAYIALAPTIEPEVRHGRWIFKKGDNKSTVDGWMCTSCKSGFNTKVPYFEVFKYCPMCGARMDGGADNDD